MSILNFSRKPVNEPFSPALRQLVQGCSIEVMPRTASKIERFADLLPNGTRVYVAHIEGTPFEDMLATAKRLSEEGFVVMPHIPARIVPDKQTFESWLEQYRDEAGVSQALVLAGGPTTPLGDFHSSMQLLESGLFDTYGFKTLHVAGHPEGNKDIDPDGSTRLVSEALQWKQAFKERTDANMAIATQFAFDAQPVLDWANALKDQGIDIPIHVGIAGPTKLQTLIKFAIACGVGPSIAILKKRAMDLTKLALPFEPRDVLEDLASAVAAGEAGHIEKLHFFPLGGITKTTDYVGDILSH